MRSLPRFAAAVALSLAALAGCPEERPGAEREIPSQRVPPAVAVDPQPAAQGAPAAPDGGVSRLP